MPGFAAENGTNNLVNRDRGFAYVHDVVPDEPWSIHIFRVERSHAELQFCTTFGRSNVLQMETVSEQVKALPADLGQPLAAVNGDFYDRRKSYEGRPRGLQIRLGEVVSSPSGHACFWVDPAGEPRMTNVESRFRFIWPDGVAVPMGMNQERGEDAAVLYTAANGPSTRTVHGTELVLEPGGNGVWTPLRAGQRYVGRVREVRTAGDTVVTRENPVLSLGPVLAHQLGTIERGAVVQLHTDTFPDLNGVEAAIGGGPTLVRDGKAREWTGMIHMRHPRTAVGWNQDFYFLVEVDGRQSKLSVGMTFPELAAYMVKLGCDQALNLDGGGSATFWVMGNVMNSPCEGRERPGVNSLVVLWKRSAK